MEKKFELATALSVAAGVLGLWFWWNEHAYAANYDSELAAQLQWVGVAIALLGAAAAIAFRELAQRDRDKP
jgi:hypothetical protein